MMPFRYLLAPAAGCGCRGACLGVGVERGYAWRHELDEWVNTCFGGAWCDAWRF
ncbi:hypothetical protein XF_0694 [Xylella fastidiosa 9a5c]|uniref:Uncharacterized protein n=1 Tax=Xylella fastidiosa (strain 9a5c) TaxID=160492 RepID=Q9PFG5_XYLFA|nr:hypothetical protein XF_0694 [Xylella fastidiosa 9a5c]